MKKQFEVNQRKVVAAAKDPQYCGTSFLRKCEMNCKMLFPLFVFFVLFHFSFMLSVAEAQNIGINTTGASPDVSAGLDVNYTNKGILIPRVALLNSSDAITILAPAYSLLVYNSGTGGLSPAGYYYNSNTTPGSATWTQLGSGGGSGWLTTGNTLTGTLPASPNEWIGTLNAADWIVKINNTERMRVGSTGGGGNGRVEFWAANQWIISDGLNASLRGGDAGVSGMSFMITNNSACYSPSGIILYPANFSGGCSNDIRVGIDNFTPGSKLGVNGNMSIGAYSGTAAPANGFIVSGNVGIGTSNPAVKLQINSATNTEFLRMDRGAGNPFQIFFGDNLAGTSNATGVVYFDVVGPGTENFVFGGHINPDSDANRDCGTNTKSWGNVYAYNYPGPSDKRKKENIEPLKYGLNQVMKLNPVSFTWKKFPDWGNQLGFIAQEVQTVLPELVKEGNDAEKSLTMDYIKLIPVLVKAMQQQQKIIEEQQKRIEELEKRCSIK